MTTAGWLLTVSMRPNQLLNCTFSYITTWMGASRACRHRPGGDVKSGLRIQGLGFRADRCAAARGRAGWAGVHGYKMEAVRLTARKEQQGERSEAESPCHMVQSLEP